MTTNVTAASVTKEIQSIKRRTTTLVFDKQVAAANASEVTSRDGNPYLLTQLMAAMGKGDRRDAMQRHIETHTPCRLRPTKSVTIKDFVSINGKKYRFTVDKGWKVSDFDLAAMREYNSDTKVFTFPWTDGTKETTPVPLDALKSFERIAKGYLAGDKPVVAGQEKAVRDVAKLLGFEV
jgi:hypothetical protein